MELIDRDAAFPCSTAVITSGRLLETVLVGIRPDEETPVPGGIEAELREIFRQLDEVLAGVGVDKHAIASVRLYLQNVNAEIGRANGVYREYMGDHAPVRRAYGVDLQCGMAIEACFVVELPA